MMHTLKNNTSHIGAASSYYHRRDRSIYFRMSAYFSALEVMIRRQAAFANIELVIKIHIHHRVVAEVDASRIAWAKISIGSSISLTTPQEI